MAHDHNHDHGDATAYFTEQLFNIAVCAALGGVMAMMYFNGMLTFLFSNNEVQHVRVLLGGAGLLAIVLIRAVYVWRAAGSKKAGVHNHDHDDCDHGDCGHDHHHDHDHHHHHNEHKEGVMSAPSSLMASLPTTHAHNHGHDHDHGWAPWRFVLLLLPVVLFFLGIPNQGILAKGPGVKLSEDEQKEMDRLAAGHTKGDEVQPMTFLQLERVAMSKDGRDVQAGKLISVTGVYLGNAPDRFTLRRYKQNCCAADAIPLNAIIMLSPESQKKDYKLNPADYQEKWVTVTGRLEFLYKRSTNEFITAVFLDPDPKHPLSEVVKVVPPDPNPYAY